MTSEDSVRMMTAPAPTPAYPEDNVAKLQRVMLRLHLCKTVCYFEVIRV